jgi:hypothetical protein
LEAAVVVEVAVAGRLLLDITKEMEHAEVAVKEVK